MVRELPINGVINAKQNTLNVIVISFAAGGIGLQPVNIDLRQTLGETTFNWRKVYLSGLELLRSLR